VLILEVELTTTDELEIMYEGIFEGNEIAMSMWFVILGIGHYVGCEVECFKSK
jgi:hypothetical protein